MQSEKFRVGVISQALLGAIALTIVVAPARASASTRQTVELHLSERFRLGAATGDPDYQFFEVVAARTLPGDVLVVADRGSQSLRFFDSRGRLIRRAGGPGEGPGEYRQLTNVVLWRDSLFAYDHGLARVTVLDANGTVGRTFRIAFDDRRPLQDVLGIIEPGLVIGEAGTIIGPSTESRIRRDSFSIAAYDLTGRLVRPIGTFNGTQQLVLVDASRGSLTVSKQSLTYGKATYRLASQTRIVVGETDRYAVLLYDAEGRLAGRVEEPRRPRPVTMDEQARQHRRLTSSASPDRRRQIENALRGVPLPETQPMFSGLAVAPDGLLLVREVAETGARSVAWRLYAATGQALGQLMLPSSARVLDAHPDHVVTVETDDLGEESIVWRSITR